MSASYATSTSPFYVAAVLSAAAAAACIGRLFLVAEPPAGELASPILLVAGVGFTFAALSFFVWPTRVALLTAPLVDLPSALHDVRSQLVDLLAIRKEYNKVRSDIEGYSAQTAEMLRQVETALAVELATVAKQLAELRVHQPNVDRMADELKKLDLTLMDLRQAKGDADRRTADWKRSNLQFLQLLERTADLESDSDSSYRIVALKLAAEFETAFAPLGLRVFRPAAGSHFDDRVHEIEGEIESREAEGAVAACVRWGYSLGDSVQRKALVRLAKKPAREREPELVAASHDNEPLPNSDLEEQPALLEETSQRTRPK